MKIEKTMVEEVVTKPGYQLTVTERQLRILRAVLGKADFEEVRYFLACEWPREFSEEDKSINNEVYQMYTAVYDVR